MNRRNQVMIAALTLTAAACTDGSAPGRATEEIAPSGAVAAEPVSEASVAARDSAEAEAAAATDGSDGTNLPMAGQLTAGAWSDADHWDFWTSLMDDGYDRHLERWGFDLVRRVTVQVTDSDGALRNVDVKLLDERGESIWDAKTNGEGNTVLFAGQQDVGPFRVQVADEAPRKVVPGETLNVRLNEGPEVADSIDVMFVVDTTGSMGDELAYIQSELTDVTKRVKQRTRGEFALRLAASVYRDHNDDFLVRSSRFSTDVGQAKQFLAAQHHGGGGDFPEAVDEALADAIHEHQWDPGARARVLFLVLDAPPHDDQEGKARLHRAVRAAAKQGIQLIPVVGSGIDKPTEFLMRSMALSTNGTYVFLTNDSGIGGGHIEPTTGEFEVEKLNDLLVRLIVEAAS